MGAATAVAEAEGKTIPQRPPLALPRRPPASKPRRALGVTITVTGTGATPTGSVILSSGSYTSSATTLTAGSATITIPAGSLTAGTATLTAKYTPDSASSSTYYSASGTGSVRVTLSPVAPTVTVTPEETTHRLCGEPDCYCHGSRRQRNADRQRDALQRKLYFCGRGAELTAPRPSTFSPARWPRAPIRSPSPIRPTPTAASTYADFYRHGEHHHRCARQPPMSPSRSTPWPIAT